MKFNFRIQYEQYDDRQVIAMILAIPHNEEAAAFLLYNRYDPLLHKVYRMLVQNSFWYDDCVDELFLHLRGNDREWRPLATIQWRSTFGCWLKRVAYRKFIEVLPSLIENDRRTTSIDIDDPSEPQVQLPDGGEEEYESRQRKVILMEAIGQLKDEDQRFVILKRLEGYDSREIALLLQKRWQKHGIVKYNNRHERVVPDAAYVDVRTQRAKENLRLLIVELK